METEQMNRCKCGKEGKHRTATGEGIELLCDECDVDSFHVDWDKVDLDKLRKERDKLKEERIKAIPLESDRELLLDLILFRTGEGPTTDETIFWINETLKELIKRKLINKARCLNKLNENVTYEEYKRHLKIYGLTDEEQTFGDYREQVLKARETLISNPTILNELRRINGN